MSLISSGWISSKRGLSPRPLRRLRREVLPLRQQQAEDEIAANRAAKIENPNARTNSFYQKLLDQWWLHMTGRAEMTNALKTVRRYITCSRVTKRPVFDFVSNAIRPDSSLKVFAFDDDYSFGILQSNAHWQWFTEKASTLKADYRYTSHSVYDTFPFPQSPAPARVKAVADAARELHEFRRQRMSRSETLTLRRDVSQPGCAGHKPLARAARCP